MNKKDLFPYANRALGTQELIFEKSERKTPEHLSIIAIANLKKGDKFSFEGEHFNVFEASSTVIKIKGSSSLEITENNLRDNPLYSLMCKCIGKDIDGRVDSIEHIIERDPALYRARIGGWILIDELVKMTGNIQYPSSQRLKQKETKVANKIEMEDVIPSNPPQETIQMGFDF